MTTKSDPLYGKKILFIGDSITEASKDLSNRSGWAGRIGEAHQMKWKNRGVSGTSLSAVRSGRIIDQLDDEDYDFVIFNGGMNDALSAGEIGDLSCDASEQSLSTLAGGLKELIQALLQKYPQAVIGYIVTYQTPNSNWGGNTSCTGPYFQMARQVCQQYRIPFLDLFEGSVMEDGRTLSYSKDILEMDKAVSLYDQDPGEIHLGAEGYDRISPYIDKWIQKIAFEKDESQN